MASDGASACRIISPHRSDAVSAEVIGGSSFMIVRSRVSLSGSKLLCPAVVIKIVDRVIAGIAQGPHQRFRLIEMAHPVVTPMHDMNGDVSQWRCGREYSCYRDSARRQGQGIRH